MFLSRHSHAAEPLQELDRFFPAPRDGRPSSVDAQCRATERLIHACAAVDRHSTTLDNLERFVRGSRDPARTRRRITLALALELPSADLVYGRVGSAELAMFRSLARRKPAAVVWVFS